MKSRLIKFWILLTVIFFWQTLAMAGQPATKGNRLIGHGITEGANEFGAAFALARDAGLEFIELPLAWDSVETAPGRYHSNILTIANAFFPFRNVKVFLTVNPIDTNNLRMPADLKNKAFDDPEVIERYRRLLDYVFDHVGQLDLIGFGIGNEIDAYLANHKTRWKQYQKFYEAGRSYIKDKRPGLKVGTKAMMYGHIFNHTAELQEMNRNSDLIMVTYYPLKDGFRVHDPAVVHDHFKRLTDIYAGRPTSMLEAGYPASTYLGSSEQKQVAFIRELFKAWDNHRTQILHMNFMWLHDVSDAKLKEFETYYRISSKGFIEFLATLGLRTYNGKDKPAFNELKRQVRARAWQAQDGKHLAASPDKTVQDDPPSSTASTHAEGAVKMGFSKQSELFACADGSFVSLDHAGPHPDLISMRWNYRYADDWMWCLRGVNGQTLKNISEVSVWLKSDRKGPIFLRIDESDGESFFAVTKPGLDWQKFEFTFGDFSIDEKTRRNGRLEPAKIINLIIAEPPAADKQSKATRTVWISNLIFK